MLPEFFEFFSPTRIIYGVGLAKDFSSELAQINVSKLFIVTDKIIRETGIVDPVIEGFKDAGIEIAGIFDEVPPNSEIKIVKKGADLAKEAGSDGIVAIGGGSVIDTAKAMNILVSEGGDLMEDYSGAHTLTRPLKPLIVIPTTSGTGSEVTLVAVIKNDEERVKCPFTDKYLLPNIAVLDPEMTYTMPAKVTASTGMDALTHAIEAYIGPQFSPMSDSFAEGAIRLVMEHLVNACKSPEDPEARGGMSIAACMAGVAFSHSMVGVVHGMSHTLGGLHSVPHGIGNAICLPYGMEYNLEVAAPKFAYLAKIMGQDTAGMDETDAARKAIDAVFELRAQLKEVAGLPDRLSEVGIKKEHLPDVAEGVLMDGTSFYNPREVIAEEVLKQLEKAF